MIVADDVATEPPTVLVTVAIDVLITLVPAGARFMAEVQKAAAAELYTGNLGSLAWSCLQY